MEVELPARSAGVRRSTHRPGGLQAGDQLRFRGAKPVEQVGVDRVTGGESQGIPRANANADATSIEFGEQFVDVGHHMTNSSTLGLRSWSSRAVRSPDVS